MNRWVVFGLGVATGAVLTLGVLFLWIAASVHG